MNQLLFRLFFIFLFGIGLFTFVFPWSNYNIQIPYTGNDYKLGLDLQGGIELDYKIDLDEAKKEDDYNQNKEKSIIEGLKSIIDKRIEALHINDSVITSANYAGEQHIIVQIPLKGNNDLENNENIKRAKEAIGKVVKIEFREQRKEITQADLEERKNLAQKALEELKNNQYSFDVVSKKYKDTYENISQGIVGEELFKDYIVYSGGTEKGLINEVLYGTGFGDFENDNGYYIVETIKDDKKLSYNYLYVSSSPSEWKPAMDSKGRILNDKYFLNSSVQYNEAFQAMIELSFNDEGGEIFSELTKRLVGERIAIFVGGENLTAPNVNEPILNGRAVITGNYTSDEAKELSQNINTGVVPAPIYLTSEKTIDSKLGVSSLEKLVIAGGVGFLFIFVFLVLFYRLAGFLSSIALFMYIIIILAIVKTFGIILTLASIAGLILSVGMAIDANILIFERVKDELRSGKKLHEAVNIGFKKSFSAIWDSNVTGFIVAIILFVFGINLIKGFGLMLALGIVVSLFSVYYISRVLIFYASKSCKKESIFIGK